MNSSTDKIPKKPIYKTVKKIVRRKSSTASKLNQSEIDKKLSYYKRRVEYAIARGKVFRVIGNVGIGKIRLELHKRGFIETVSNNWQNNLYNLSDIELLNKIETNNEYEMALLTKLLGERDPDFIWINRTSSFSYYQYVAVMNKINILSCNFVVKDGLCELIDTFRQNQPTRITDINHPRTYIVSSENYFEKFISDYRLTLATGLILYLCNNKKREPVEYFSCDGNISLDVLDFALKVIQIHLDRKQNYQPVIIENEEKDELNFNCLTDALTCLTNKTGKFHLDVNDKENIALNHENDGNIESDKLENYCNKITKVATSILKRWPWRKHDGFTNVWLIKPARTGEGAGILLSRDASTIKDFINRHKYKPFVIQKYLERPLLCYRTKFDFRHYFLITIDNNYFRTWSHSTACTIKFASEQFDLQDFSESRHITNTAVQMKYAKVSHPNLPYHHMWSLGAFILYLNTFDKGYLWNDYIYPRMIRTIQAITEASLNNIELTPGRFELFGCDWMLTNDFRPYLLEINRCPSLEYYSPVSEIVVGKVTEDLVKVTVDYLKDKKASTGDFELIFETRLPEKISKSDDDDEM
uniref:CSON008388 protein n=1 Tax=Culicoides sonorensis TaxID=179676 RepID=A0A336LZA5_CULSO